MFLVVFEHAAVLIPGGGPPVVVQFVMALAPFRMPALMFLSGMLLEKSLSKPAGRFVLGKVDRILWPYLVWSVVFVLVAIPGNPPPDLMRELFLDPTSPTWYLAYLFLFFIVTLLLPPIARTLLIPIALTGGLLVDLLTSDTAFTTEAPATHVQRLLFTFAMFLCGDLFARHGADILRVLRHRRVVVAVCVIIAGLAAAASGLGISVQWRAGWVVPVIAGILAAIPLVGALSRTRIGRAFDALGRESIVYYLLHWPAQIIAFHALFAIGVDDVFVVFAVDLVVGLAAPVAVLRLRDRLPVTGYLFDLDLRSAGSRPHRRRSDPIV